MTRPGKRSAGRNASDDKVDPPRLHRKCLGKLIKPFVSPEERSKRPREMYEQRQAPKPPQTLPEFPVRPQFGSPG